MSKHTLIMLALTLASGCLVVSAVLMIAGVISFGGEWQDFIATLMIAISFTLPFVAPPPFEDQ